VPERQSGVAVPVPQLDDWTTLPTIIRLQGTLGQTEFDCRVDSYSQSHQNDSNSSIECSTYLPCRSTLSFFPLISLSLEISGTSDSSAPHGATSHCQLHAAAHYGELSLRSDHRMRVETPMFHLWQSKSTQGQDRYACATLQLSGSVWRVLLLHHLTMTN
jgi:hypothetical protein